MSSYPLRDGEARGPEETEILSVVDALQGLKGFAERLISPALSPLFDGTDFLQECFVCARSRLGELGAMKPCERLDWLREVAPAWHQARHMKLVPDHSPPRS